MSHFQMALQAAVIARLKADTGTGGLFNVTTPLVTGASVDFNPARQPLPFITYVPTLMSNYDAVGTRCEECEFDIHVWIQASPENSSGSSAAFDPLVREDAIVSRIFGNWPSVSVGVAPGYGLDRFRPDITSSGWTADTLRRTSDRRNADETIIQHTISFRCLVSEVSV